MWYCHWVVSSTLKEVPLQSCAIFNISWSHMPFSEYLFQYQGAELSADTLEVAGAWAQTHARGWCIIGSLNSTVSSSNRSQLSRKIKA